jgi:hypothetical protein
MQWIPCINLARFAHRFHNGDNRCVDAVALRASSSWDSLIDTGGVHA